MAKQIGIVPLQGTIGNITFAETKHGVKARKKNKATNNFANNPNMQRVRENGAEFGRAGTAGMLLRKSLTNALVQTGGKNVVPRLLKEMMKVIKSDIINPRGQRTPADGVINFLEGFEFNDVSKLSVAFKAEYTAVIDRVTGELTIKIPPFVPADLVAAAPGSTHFKIISAAADIDFINENYSSVNTNSEEIPWNGTQTQPITLLNKLSPNSENQLFLVLGIVFFQQVSGVMYPLKAGASNALAIVKTSGS
jgi:hypothetical protein